VTFASVHERLKRLWVSKGGPHVIVSLPANVVLKQPRAMMGGCLTVSRVQNGCAQFLCRGRTHEGQVLTRERIDVLRTTALRSAPPSEAPIWGGITDDTAFLTAYATAMLAPEVSVDGEVIAVPEERRLLLQAAAAACMSAPAWAGAVREPQNGAEQPSRTRSEVSVASGRGGGGRRYSSGGGTIDMPELPRIDLSELPNTAEARQLREFAAKCEVHVQLHETQVKALPTQCPRAERPVRLPLFVA
jgi:nitrogen fixation protein